MDSATCMLEAGTMTTTTTMRRRRQRRGRQSTRSNSHRLYKAAAAAACLLSLAAWHRNVQPAGGARYAGGMRALADAGNTTNRFEEMVINASRAQCNLNTTGDPWTDLTSCRVPTAVTQTKQTCCFVRVMTSDQYVPDGADKLCQLDSQMQYLHFYYCSGDFKFVTMGLMVLWLLYLFILLGSTADEFFCPAVEELSRVLNIPPRVAGVTLLALGNGAPDIMSFLASINAGEFTMAVGALTGAGNFVAVAIVGAVSIVCASGVAGELKARGMFFRDVGFLLLGYCMLTAIMLDGTAYLWQAIVFVAMYLFFVLMVILGSRIPPLLKEDRGAWDDMKAGKKPSSNKLQSSEERADGLKAGLLGDTDENPDEVAQSPRGVRDAHDYFLPRFGEIHTSEQKLHITTTHALRRPKATRDQGLDDQPAAPRKKNQPLAYNWRTTSMSSMRTTSGLMDSTKVGKNKSFARYQMWKRIGRTMDLDEMEALDKFIAFVELPFTLARAASIPAVVEEDSDEEEEEEEDDGGALEPGAWDDTFMRMRMICNPPCTAAFMTWQLDGDGVMFGHPAWMMMGLFFLPASALMVLLTRDQPSKLVSFVYLLISFVSGLLWLGLVADELVALLTSFGDIFNIDNAILGLTVLAIGNSLGDWAADTSVAKNGFPNMAMSACYGGPFFNLSIGLGVGLYQVISKSGKPYPIPPLPPTLFISAGFCMSGLILTAVLALATGFRLPPWVGKLCILWYILFCVVIVVVFLFK